MSCIAGIGGMLRAHASSPCQGLWLAPRRRCPLCRQPACRAGEAAHAGGGGGSGDGGGSDRGCASEMMVVVVVVVVVVVTILMVSRMT